VAILGFFGIETTTFAALMAGVGVAIGAAWSGLLAPHWQVYVDTNRAIRETFGAAGFPAAEQPIVVRTDGPRVPSAVPGDRL
jgi:hypothetical protein